MTERQINRSLLSSKFEDDLKQSKALKESILSHFDHQKYSIMNQAAPAQIFTYQFFAVFLFTFVLCSAVNAQEVEVQAAGSILFAIFIMTPFCGANINPMVTLSNCIKKENKYKRERLPLYWLAQILGALAGLLFSEFLGRAKQAQLLLDEGSDIWKVISNEAMGIFIFIFFMLLLSNPNTTFIENQLTGYISIAIFYHLARSFAPAAGLAINPALTIALSVQYASIGKWASLSNCWAWLVGDLCGCILATYFYEKIYEPIVIELRQIKRKSQNFQSLTDDSTLSHKDFLDK